MNRESTYNVTYTIIHTEGVSTGVTFGKSVKGAISAARSLAWEDHDRVSPNNWADVWLTVTKGGNTLINDFAPSHLL